MKTETISSVKTHLPKKKAFSIETRKGDLPLHSLCVLSGRRGGGKSVATANLLKDYKENKGYYDYVLLVSPTYSSNREIWDIAGIQEEHVFEPTSGVVKRITNFVENERAEWDEYCVMKQQWSKLHKKLRRGDDAFVSDDELLEAHAN
eukprot:1681261-Pleurochrysis_carterae.AAC.1